MGDRLAASNLQVVVVDSNAASRLVLGELLSRWGIHVEAPATIRGACAIQASSKSLETILFADAQVQGIDELQAAPRTDAGAVVVLMLSGCQKAHELSLSRELNAAAFLVKPLAQAELWESIRRVLAESRREPVRSLSSGGSEHQPFVDGAVPSLRILLAEDNPINQKVAMRLLERRGTALL